MFSYRHAFHAGNHADVLKHMALLATLRHLHTKEGGLRLVDTHAGAGLYRLDHEQARTSGEAAHGVGALWDAATRASAAAPLPDAVQDYLGCLRSFNPDGTLLHYPGSPALLQALLRPQDRLTLFELHPTDGRLLDRAVRAWRQRTPHPAIELRRDNGFDGLRALLPPPTRRGLVLIDPSYELKTDYACVAATVADALARFAVGCYLVWYPVIGRTEAHQLPRRLRALAQRAQRPWLQAELNVGARPDPQAKATAARGRPVGGLRASGLFVINPPYTLAAQLRAALPWVLAALRQGTGADWRVATHEG
ncbi:Ribosomal RNA large subunit methyltransferase J [Tepidimonas thermarum]|uniref:Ribosomal RNA large subunit methyltransferase J n=1 Tax=Tepidimonas thermarum TaxID=335431 RepID=A0A554X848_9BURK|nr:23S rRNA (adenine(2030)-N(6))-methyltransferase RlmJ [Tepidimonas thermarum]TSE31990.1 Ribosomal RNA large subunit methyltransferase J [Tepidimonas thermarum]